MIPIVSSTLTVVDVNSSAQDAFASRTASTAKPISSMPIQLNRMGGTVRKHSEQYPESKDEQLYDEMQGPVIDADVESGKE